MIEKIYMHYMSLAISVIISLIQRLSLLSVCTTFDPYKRKAEGEPGIFSHVIDVTMHHISHGIACLVEQEE